MQTSDNNPRKHSDNFKNEDHGKSSRVQPAVVSVANLRMDGRITELEKEWDVERTVELNCAILAIAGTALGVFVNKRWFALPVLAATFLSQNSIQGWTYHGLHS